MGWASGEIEPTVALSAYQLLGDCWVWSYFRERDHQGWLARIVSLWSILQHTFQILFGIVPVWYFCWSMGRCLCAFMCEEVQSVGQSQFSLLCHDVKYIFFVGHLLRSSHFEEQTVTPSAQLGLCAHACMSCSSTLIGPKWDIAALDRV